MSTIAVVGVTGTVGSRVAELLAAKGYDIRGIARNPGENANGIESVAADLSSSEQVQAALEGVDGVYLTPILGGEHPAATETQLSRNVIDAAAREAVDQVVMHTALHADRGDTGATILDNKTGLEEALAQSGVGYTVLRPPWFLQNLWAARDYIEQGVVSLPWPGDMVWGAVDVGDLARAAVAFFEQGPANRGFDLHIPGGITGARIAAAASEALGREVSYQEAPVSTRQYVDSFPITEPHKDLYAELFDYFKSQTYIGHPEELFDTLDGFQPRSVEDFMREELFAQS